MKRLLVYGCIVVIVMAALFVVGAIRDRPMSVENPGDGSLVVVSDQDIPAGTSFNRLIANGDLHQVMVPANLIVPNALTEVSQLRGMIAFVPIYQNEQIPVDRIGRRADICHAKPPYVCN